MIFDKVQGGIMELTFHYGKLQELTLGVVIFGILALNAPLALALNANGPLLDILVDASSGELGSGEAQTVLARLNQFDLSAYSLQFNDGSRLSLNLSPGALNRALLAREETGVDLSAIRGPGGTLTFGTEDITCGNLVPTFEANALLAVENCIGTQSFEQSANASAAAALAQINTIDLLINRPTTQMMIDIRRFVSRKSGNPSDQEQGGGASADDYPLAGPWGFYFQGGGSFANVNGSPGRTGFNLNNQLATGGVDYRFSDAVVTGFLFNFTGSSTALDRNAGQLDADIYRFMPFLNITPFENAYVDIVAGYSYHTYSSNRSSRDLRASADYSADQAIAAINLGYTYPIGALDITPFAGGSYIYTDVGGYAEQGQGNLLRVDGRRVSSWTSSLGLQLAYAYSAPFGVLQPNLRLEWVHEFANDRRGVSVFVPAQSLVVTLPTAEPIRDWGNVAAGVQTILPNGIMGFVNYQAQVMSSGENHMVEGGVRLEF